MSWPIPVFLKIEYPEPISLRVWLPTLVAVASCTVTAVLLVWPHGKPTNTLLFWGMLVGAPLVACSLLFGWRLKQWEGEQRDAEDDEAEQEWLKEGWRGWGRRQACVIDVAAFPTATDEINRFSAEKFDLPPHSERSITFDWVNGRTTTFRRTRLLRLIASRFAEALRGRRGVIVTLMLDGTSLKQAEDWKQQARRTFGPTISDLHVEVQPATGGVEWITQLVDRVDPATRLVISAQLWGNEGEHAFSEGAAAFLVEPGATNAGLIFRPMTSTHDTMKIGLGQIREYQMASERLEHVWFANCEYDKSTAIRSALAPKPKDMPGERLLDNVLGTSGTTSGWIVMEAMRGARPQLVAWHEPESECLYSDATAVNATQTNLAARPNYPHRADRHYALGDELGSLRDTRNSFSLDSGGLSIMKIVNRIFLLSMVLSACSLAAHVSYAASGISSECKKGGADKFSIREYEKKMVSVCPADSSGDCLYTVTYGKTVVDSRIHLKSDHLKDYVIKDFSTGYGNNDVVHFMLFAQCPDGSFLQVGDDFFTTVKPDAVDRTTGWLKLHVTRDCYSDSIGDTQERSYTIVFDPKRKKYGPPDSNPKLTHYCSDAELALPPDSASAPR